MESDKWNMMNSKRLKLDFTDYVLIMVAILWGMNYVIVKVSLKEMNPLLFNTLRFVIGAIVCWIILLVKETNYKITKKEMLNMVILGIGIHSINQLAFIYGVAKTTAGTASIILASTPVWVAVIARIIGIEKTTLKMWSGIGISFLGAILVVGNQGLSANISQVGLQGNILIVIATIFWSIYTITVRILTQKLSIIKVTTYSLTFAAIFFISITSKEIINTNWDQFSVEAWLGVIYSGVFVFGISYILWNYVVKEVGATRASIYTNLPPFVSILLGWIFLGEKINFVQICGGFFILIGLYYVNFDKIHKNINNSLNS